MLVKEAINGCSTGQIDGLSQQLLTRITNKGYLVKIDHRLICCEGRHNNPYLQQSAYEALVNAAESKGRRIVINSCLRTPMQQYMLRKQYKRGICGITAAAPPGKSNHQSGLAVDIQDYLYWRQPLQRYGWKWLGAWDKWHFDYQINGLDLGKIQIQEFQELWNENNPKKKLKVDGLYGAKTGNAIGNSPVSGFNLLPVLKRGDMNKDVGRLQLKLREALKLYPHDLAADCKFGGQTAKAIISFQRLNGLETNGIADRKTLAALGFVL